MAPNKEPGQNGFDPNNLNLDSIPSSPYRTLVPSRQYYPQIPNPHISKTNTMTFEDNPGEGFLTNSYRSDVSMYNDIAFLQNQFFSSPLNQASHNSFLNAHPTPPTIPHVPQQLNSRAAELKARLLKQRASSAGPSAGIPGPSTQSNRMESSSSLRGSPITANGDGGKQEHDVDQLISEYSQELKPAGNSSNKQEPKKDLRPQPPLRSLTAPTNSVVIADSLGSPQRVSKPTKNGNIIPDATATAIAMEKKESSGYSSGISEGEIFDDPPGTNTPSWAPSKPDSESPSVNDQFTCRPRSNSIKDMQMASGPRENAPRPRSATTTKSQSSRDQEDGWDSINRPESRSYVPNFIGNRAHAELSAQPKSRENRGRSEHPRTKEIAEPKADDPRPICREKSKIPTLAQVLPHDDDLRDWLEITAYHNETYREKTLRRHRALDELNTQSEAILAKRNALMAEMEAEEDDTIPLMGRLIMKANTTPAPTTIKTEQPERPNKRPHSSPNSPSHGPSKLQRRDSRITQAIDESYHPHFRPRSRSPHYTTSRPSPSARRTRDEYFEREREREIDADRHPDGRGNYRGKNFDPNFRSRSGGRGRGEYTFASDSRSESYSKGKGSLRGGNTW